MCINVIKEPLKCAVQRERERERLNKYRWEKASDC